MTVHTMRFFKSALRLLMTANVLMWHRTEAHIHKSTGYLLMTADVLNWHRTEATTSMRMNESPTPQNASVWQRHMAHITYEVRCTTLSGTIATILTCLRPHYDKDVLIVMSQLDCAQCYHNVSQWVFSQSYFNATQCTRRPTPSLGSTQCLSFSEVSENPDYGRAYNVDN